MNEGLAFCGSLAEAEMSKWSEAASAKMLETKRGPVAQLDRASVFGSKTAVLQGMGFAAKSLKTRPS
jgi:hypothetical protein